MIKQLTLLLGIGSAALFPTKAADLASALKSGAVCERIDGYIQATPGNEAQTAHLVSEVNAKRGAVYAEIAAKEGINPAIVAAQSASEERASNPSKFCK